MYNLETLNQIVFLSQVVHREELPSTNDFAKHLLANQKSLSLPALILAERQTRGRGRGRNLWWSSEGAVTMSLVLDPTCFGITRNDSPRFSATVAFALLQTLEKIFPSSPEKWGYHWPNDVYLDDKKLAGILLESPSEHAVVLGIGINVNQSMKEAPEPIRRTSISLFDHFGKTTSRTDMLVHFLQELEKVLSDFSRRSDEVAQELNRRCLQRDREIVLENPGQCFSGRCLGIDTDGAIRLETGEGTVSFYNGTTRRREPEK
jgi:BirA family biotin operon repressor/biotin-[acetyl-CoA-carboxylase] ligase